MKIKTLKSILATTVLASAVSFTAGSVNAGSIVLTGHDILSHGNQNGYNLVILDYLRGAGTTGEITRANYDVGTLRAGFNAVSGGVFGSHSSQNVSSFGSAAAFTTFLGTVDAIVLPEFTDVTTLATAPYKAAIETFFNAGGDIWVDSNNNNSNYYDWLPPGVAATGVGISGSSGFAPTAEGAAIGITNSMVNGFPTHNIFTSFDSDFEVLEVRTSDQTALTIGIQDAQIVDGGITTVSEPSAIMLIGIGIAGLGFARRQRRS